MKKYINDKESKASDVVQEEIYKKETIEEEIENIDVIDTNKVEENIIESEVTEELKITSEPTLPIIQDDSIILEEPEDAEVTQETMPIHETQEEVAEETIPTETTEEEINHISLGQFKLTAYCSCAVCCGQYAYNRPVDENGNQIVYGSTGTRLVPGVSIAVDPNVIPYGSEVIINGHTYVAHDTGGAIKGNRIDVYFDNHDDALNFGLQYAEVFISEN